MRFLCVIGTRPEAIKLAPLILELGQQWHVTTLCSGQHTSLAKEPLGWFGIEPTDVITVGSQFRTLSQLTGSLLAPMERALKTHSPDVVIAQGDTTTVLVSALTCFYLGIPFAHVEAGLRTGDLLAPFPEEFNRTVVGRVARWNFCPSVRAAANLHAEGVDPARVFVTGNTGIDALRLTLENVKVNVASDRRRILVTTHRRENHGARMNSVCKAVRDLACEFADIEFAVSVHPNPAVRESLEKALGGRDRIRLLPPLLYPEFVSEMARSYLILTDSGGIQEEASYLKKPVLVLRDVTDRPETVEMGTAQIVGTEPTGIIRRVRELLVDSVQYSKMAKGGFPYGEGHASRQIGLVFEPIANNSSLI